MMWRAFLFCLSRKRVYLDEENRVHLMESRGGKVFVKYLYKAVESGASISFSMQLIWSLCV